MKMEEFALYVWSKEIRLRAKELIKASIELREESRLNAEKLGILKELAEKHRRPSHP